MWIMEVQHKRNFLESIFKFLHLLLRELIKRLSPNEAISSTFSVDMHYYIVCSDSKPQKEFFRIIFEIFTSIAWD